ncbi:hypothetical protein ZIOFF_072707 [Zingiber officinale]|uniref:Pentatricopeptide repeat-containing protein n=1 Tax=Zingiber officinale TaxID=94328 RepID=A0A8J5BVA2_ZINOF|nr:hypothetical protein ZIOFF_072707 [Zingiber officinale]
MAGFTKLLSSFSPFYHEKEGSFGPNVYSYTVLVLGLRKEELWEEAYRVLKLMEDEGCMPTVVAFTILIRSLCKKKGSFLLYTREWFIEVWDGNNAIDLLQKVVYWGNNSRDIVTWNMYFHCLCCKGNMDEIHIKLFNNAKDLHALSYSLA